VYTSDSLESILSQLSTRMMNIIADGNHLQDLYYLLEFLATWEKRPRCLTPLAYQWCSAFSKAAGRFKWSELTLGQKILQQLRSRLQGPTLSDVPGGFRFAQDEFPKVGRDDILHLDGTSHRTHGSLQDMTLVNCVDLLPMTLEVGFRLVTPSRD
jgi:hypothetical protein